MPRVDAVRPQTAEPTPASVRLSQGFVARCLRPQRRGVALLLALQVAQTLATLVLPRLSADVIDRVGLTPWKDNGAGQLSGGQQQRVAIARALAMGPALLLADEPTGNLDTKSADEVFALLRRFNLEQGTTVLFVTHNVALSERCDRTIEVIDGRVTGR